MNFNQSAPEHRCEIIPGDPSTSLGKIGCGLMAVWLAGQILASGAGRMTPPQLVEAARTRNGFVGGARNPNRKTLIVWGVVAALVGCRVDVGIRWLRNSPDVSALRHGIADCFARGELAILHVDRDEEGKHYVLALSSVGGVIEVADPAGGKMRTLDAMTLTGTSPHGPDRPYRVRGVMPIGRAVQ